MAHEKTNELNDQSFDESELQDIMNEIESLEQDFAGASQSPREKAIDAVETELAVAEVLSGENDDTIVDADAKAGDVDGEDAGIDATTAEIDVSAEDLNAETLSDIDGFLSEQSEDFSADEGPEEEPVSQNTGDNVIVLNGAKADSPMDLNIHGNMAFNLCLPLNGQAAKLTVNGATIELAVGDVTVEVTSEGMAIDLPQGKMSFPVDKLLQKKAS